MSSHEPQRERRGRRRHDGEDACAEHQLAERDHPAAGLLVGLGEAEVVEHRPDHARDDRQQVAGEHEGDLLPPARPLQEPNDRDHAREVSAGAVPPITAWVAPRSFVAARMG